uniref:Uncharacterized protein n=1 Tax=Ditylenchus dipsaci TaxID=166011 RepID=A0A915DXQ5_9BILA
MRIQENYLGDVAAKYYTQIVDQCFSDDGKYVISINSFGHIISCPCPSNDSAANSVSNTGNTHTNLHLTSGKSLANVLVCGDANGNVHGFNSSSLIESATANTNGSISLHDIEVLRKPISVFGGHSQKINKLAKRSEFEFVSCSDDGLVQFWDSRLNKKPPRTLQVASHSQVSRLNCANEIYAVDVDDDFVVCGGGVDLSMWHLSSSSLALVLNNGEDGDQTEICSAVEMVDGQILAGATTFTNNATLHRYNYSGSSILSLKINMNSIRNIHTAEFSTQTHKTSVVSGESSQLFFLTDFGFISSSINTTKSVDEIV